MKCKSIYASYSPPRKPTRSAGGEWSPGANTSLCRFAFCCRVFAHDATDLWERRWLQRPCGLCDCCVSTEGSHVCHRTRRPLHHQAYRWQNHPSHCYNDCSCRRPGKLASSSQSLQPTVNELHIIFICVCVFFNALFFYVYVYRWLWNL